MDESDNKQETIARVNDAGHPTHEAHLKKKKRMIQKKLLPHVNSVKIRTKLILLGVGGILLTAFAMVAAGIWQGSVFSAQAKIEAGRLINADLNHITESIYNLIKAQDESIQQKVNHDLNVARYILNNAGKTSLAQETVPWRAVNQYTHEQVRIDLAKMMVGDRWLGQNDQMWIDTPVVDLVKRMVGGTATIFQRMNEAGDILRVVTNVEKIDGNRAIGTFIPAVNPDGSPNPVVSTVMKGETYRGIAYVVNAWYITAYEPIYDQIGSIIGVLYVGVKQENIQSLRQAILQVIVGKTGYVFVLGGQGADKGQYIISRAGRRDGENLWDSTDADNRKYVQSMVKKAIACKPGEFATERYAWQNPEEPEKRWKIARLTYYEPWDWVIGATVYEDELKEFMVPYTEGYNAMIRVFGVVALAIGLLGSLITWIFARRIENTLMVVTHAARKLTNQDLPFLVETMQSVVEGDLTVTVHFKPQTVVVTANDELGTMAHAFNSMNLALVNVGEAFTKMIANLRNLTGQLEQRVAERTSKLEASEQKMAGIIDFLPDATFVIDQDSRVIAWNRAMEKMTGITADDMIGQGDYEYAIPFYGKRRPLLIDLVMHPQERYKQGYNHLQNEGNALIGEICATHLSTEVTYLFGTATALYDANRFKIGAIETVRDITAWKQAEEELINARQVAEQATQAKSNFLANMSHEIRTPMNTIIGFAGLALKTDLDPTQHDYLKKIENSARFLLGIINDILDFSKIEAEKLRMESIPFNLDDILDNLSNLISAKAEEKGLELLLDMGGDVPYGLVGDPLRLTQVLANLTNNAIKFTHRGQIIVAVKRIKDTPAALGDQVTLCFSVEDTGIGMNQEQVGSLFTSFSQADTSTTREYGGTGLGLTISKRLVELMNGDIRVDSRPGKGSVFCFTARFGLQSESRIKTFECPADLTGMRALVVNDTPRARKIIGNALRDFSFQVDEAAAGPETIEQLKSMPEEAVYKLVVIDEHMPGLDGIEFSRIIKAEALAGQPPSVLMCITNDPAIDHNGHGKTAASHGVDGFLVKPVTPSALFDSIMKIFGWQTKVRARHSENKSLKINGLNQIRGARILLVEDNQINQQMVSALLRSEGFTVTIADNGRQCVDMVRATRPSTRDYDAVLMDIQMPVMDGYVASQKIREWEKKALSGNVPPLPIIAITAHAMIGEREKCLQAGMNDYVTKPISPRTLFKILTHWISDNKKSGIPAETATAHNDLVLGACCDGINLADGLKRAGDNHCLYMNLLDKFLKRNHDTHARLKAAIEKNRARAVELTHTLKGVSGNIGADAVYDAAKKLEQHLKQGDAQSCHILLETLDSQLQIVFRSIEKLVSNEKNRTATQPLPVKMPASNNPADPTAIFNELANSLKTHNSKAAQWVEKLETVFITNIPLRVQEIKDMIDNWEYEAALDQLKTLAAESNIILRDKNEIPS